MSHIAKSIGRNMDKLSMDEEHCRQRASACGPHQAQGSVHVSSGLVRGLQGLGFSVLAAVAGIVHEPLQEIVHNQNAR